MALFATLYSGSSGNCALVSEGGFTILIDMGGSCRRTLNALYSLGFAARDINAILLTHEHSDHVAGLATFLKHYRVPVYGSFGTLSYVKSRGLAPERASLNYIAAGRKFELGGIRALPFATSHDCAESVGYRFELASGKRLAVATDLGYVSSEVSEALDGCELVGLEANYEDELLLKGPYPYYLKTRIRSNMGHLSNAESARFAAGLAQSGAKRIVLMHLSKENNRPELALTGCLSQLENAGLSEREIKVSVAPRMDISEAIEF
ncbi:MAG: MBL fold metallo-hydrolase [Oscillospiraceae bacterium]|nr:MBL fold metallo-hydrolase [Oscillospiraceae bacterium]